MKTKDADLYTVDPEDSAAALAWATQRAAAARRLDAAHTELATLSRSLSGEPALECLARLESARAATAVAESAAIDAQSRLATATAGAETYEANIVAAAEAAVDGATRALSDALVELLREANTSAALTSTVDGLALRERFLIGTASSPAAWDHSTLPFRARSGEPPLDPQLALPALDEPDYPALISVLERLDADVDAVADLVTAESVHQLVQGNLVRSGAALDIASSGAVPDAFDVVRTPQSGAVVTHRVLLVCDADATPHWRAAEGPGGLADPQLSVWVTGLLPDPTLVGLTVQRRDPRTGQLANSWTLTLDELGVDALGIVRIAADRGELHQRIAFLARQHWRAQSMELASAGQVVISDGMAPYQLDDLFAAAERVRSLVARSRALSGDDLSAVEATPALVSAAVVATLIGRVEAVEQALEATVTSLARAALEPDHWKLVETLFAAAALSVAGATPDLQDVLPDLTVLRAQAQRSGAELSRRLTNARFVAVEGDHGTTARRARARLSALLGLRLPFLVSIPAPDSAGWAALTGATPLRGAEATTLRRWLAAYAQVRPALAALLDVYDLAETIATGDCLQLGATQLVSGPVDGVWYGASPEPPAGLTSVVVQRAWQGSLTALTGLAVDTWTQRTPGREQQAAVAFHFDEPDSTPPQAVLVAVAPDLNPTRQPNTWDLETLCDTLLSTLALAKQRATAAENSATCGVTLEQLP